MNQKKRATLSVVINTKNAATTLERTLKSVAFADTILVVDMHSTDETVAIAKKYTTALYSHEDVGYVEPARNFALSKAKDDWILVIDADEEVPKNLREFIQELLQNTIDESQQADCYYIPRQNIIFGKAINKTGWWPDYVLRLFRRGHISWSNEIHSIPITKGVVKELPAHSDIAIIHHNYQSVSQYITRLNRYTDIQAEELIQRPDTHITGAEMIHKFYSEFLSRYFALDGSKDGSHGVALSLLQGLSETTVAVKAWEKQGFSAATAKNQEDTMKELSQFRKELLYWISDWQVKRTSGITQLYWKIRRKLYI